MTCAHPQAKRVHVAGASQDAEKPLVHELAVCVDCREVRLDGEVLVRGVETPHQQTVGALLAAPLSIRETAARLEARRKLKDRARHEREALETRARGEIGAATGPDGKKQYANEDARAGALQQRLAGDAAHLELRAREERLDDEIGALTVDLAYERDRFQAARSLALLLAGGDRA